MYLSEDTVITAQDPFDPPSPDLYAGYLETPWLDPGQCQTLAVPGQTVPYTEGAFYLGAVATSGWEELFTDNNVKAGNRVTVGYKADLVVTSVTGPASVLEGELFTTTVTLCNQGAWAGSGPVQVYLSEDPIITPPQGPGGPPSADLPVGFLPFSHLEPGQCQTLSTAGQAWGIAEGAWYLGAVVSSGPSSELVLDNNTKVARLGVGDMADFVVTSVTGPASTSAGQSFTSQVRVCNQGKDARPANVRLYLSWDTVVTTADFFVGSTPTDMLSPGQCQTLTVTNWPGSTPLGSYHLGAVVDPEQLWDELFEDNNSRVGPRLTLIP